MSDKTRLAALEAVAEAARVWREWEGDQPFGDRYDMWSNVNNALDALDALDALPAVAAGGADDMTDRCEPPEDLRGVDGWHWLEFPGWPSAPYRWSGEMGRWADVCMGYDSTMAHTKGYRYLAPVTPPATVAALVEALEDMVREQQSEAQAGTGEYQRGYDDCIAAHADTARAALARVRQP